MPVHDAGRFLGACLDSLVRQTLENVEFVCVDDGSTDGSGGILDECAAKDGRFRVLHQERRGAGSARNAGLDMARGTYLFFCDSDDWCGTGLLKGLYERAERTRADIVIASTIKCEAETGRAVGCRRVSSWPRGVFSPDACGERLFSISCHTVWDKLLRRDFVCNEGLRFQEVPRFNDMLFCDLALALAKRLTTVRWARYHHRINRVGGIQESALSDGTDVLLPYQALREGLERRGLFERYGAAFEFARRESVDHFCLGQAPRPAGFLRRLVRQVVPAYVRAAL